MSDQQFETIEGRADYHAPRLLRRTAASAAAFLLPHLGPGMGVLDCGCGPGSITIGLAEAVAPGEVVGVDPDARRVDAARPVAAERSVTNVRFEQAGAHSLPFEDASFDAALMHAVSEHIADPVSAYQEVRRVLKPGGVFGVRTAEHGAALMWPPPVAEPGIGDLMRRRHALHGQNLDIGRSLRALLRAAGFSRVTGSATVETIGTADEARTHAADALRLVSDSPAFQEILAQGWIDSSHHERLKEVRAWGEHPDAFRAITWCEALGWAD